MVLAQATTQPSRTRITLNLLQNLTLREIRSEYKRTALGRVWSLINPLAQIAVFSVVFGLLLKVVPPVGTVSGVHFFPVWIGIGVITWTYFSGCIREGMGSMLHNAGLLQKVSMPRWVLVLSKILSLTFTFMIELAVIAVIMGFVGGWQVIIALPTLIPLLLLTAALAMGFALMLSVAIVYFRDIEHLWGIVAQIWMYASGVMFPRYLVEDAQAQLNAQGVLILGQPAPLLALFNLNPAERLLTMYRNVLYDFQFPNWGDWLYLSLWAAIILAIGALVFRRFSRNIVEEL